MAATLWGLYWIPLRYLENSGISGQWTSLLIYSVSFFFIFPRLFKLRADFYASKTLWFNVLSILVLAAMAFGFGDFAPDPGLMALAAAVLNAVNIALRFKTNTGVWLGKPSLDQ